MRIFAIHEARENELLLLLVLLLTRLRLTLFTLRLVKGVS